MVITTDKEALTKPFNFILKKAKSSKGSSSSNDQPVAVTDPESAAADSAGEMRMDTPASVATLFCVATVHQQAQQMTVQKQYKQMIQQMTPQRKTQQTQRADASASPEPFWLSGLRHQCQHHLW